MKALRALSKSRNENPAYKEAFNSLIYDLKKKNPKWNKTSVESKNPKWNKTSVDDHDLTARALFMEDNTDEEL